MPLCSILKTQRVTENVTKYVNLAWHGHTAASFENKLIFLSPKNQDFAYLRVSHHDLKFEMKLHFFLQSLQPTTVYFNRLCTMHSKRAGLLVVAVSTPLATLSEARG